MHRFAGPAGWSGLRVRRHLPDAVAGHRQGVQQAQACARAAMVPALAEQDRQLSQSTDDAAREVVPALSSALRDAWINF